MANAPWTARPIGSTVGLVFGGLWCMLGSEALPASWQVPILSMGWIATAALIVRLWRMPPGTSGGGTRLFRSRAYIAAVVLEIVAIYLAMRWVPAGYFIPTLGAIVGLHFIGLWIAERHARFLWIAGAMCVVSGLGALLPPGPRDAFCGFGNALVLWVFASLAL